MASVTFLPRTMSTTSRAFRGEMRTRCTLALTSISLSSSSVQVRLPATAAIRVLAVTAIGPGRGEFTKLVANHRLGHVARHVLPTVVHRNRVTNHAREDRAGPGPGADHGPLVRLVHSIDLLHQLGVDVWSLLR